ncbi:MAG: hypothetical protein WAV25_02025 [Minisyncoccia bacterium]
MKIAICGSMAFSKEMIVTKSKLEALGHRVLIPNNADKYASGVMNIETKWEKIQGDLIRNWYNVIDSMDAVLVLNYTKNNIEHYIGGNALMELGFAHILNKKIFLLNPIPKTSYTDEIEAVNPIIINGDLSLIK